jgi:four helix bundle protein
MSNIAEGFESRTDVQFINDLGLAGASAGEVRAQLYIALDQKYITEEQFKETYATAETCARQIGLEVLGPIRARHVSDDSAEYEA